MEKGLSEKTKKEVSKHGPETVISNRENIAKGVEDPKLAAEVLAEANLIRRVYNIR